MYIFLKTLINLYSWAARNKSTKKKCKLHDPQSKGSNVQGCGHIGKIMKIHLNIS